MNGSLPRFHPQSRFTIMAFAIFLLIVGSPTTSLAETKPSWAELTPFDPVGDWIGALETPGGSLRIALRIQRADKDLSATMDSLDQGVTGIPVDSITFEEGRLVAKIQAVAGGYEGVAQTDGTLDGTWTQGTLSLPLELSRQDGPPAAPKRPQEPVGPFPYRSETVEMENPAAGVTLAGTLTLPEGNGPFPAVILISGSGAQDRDSTILGHRPFWVIADHLTRNGIAVLRYDDRGTAKSTGDFKKSTSEGFADDAMAAVRFLEARDDVSTIGLIGHSEGGIIAPMVAAQSEDVDFLVLLAGPGTPGRQVLLDQTELVLKAGLLTPEQLQQNRRLQGELFDRILDGSNMETIEKALDELVDFQSGGRLSKDERRTQVEIQAPQLTSTWFRFFLAYDPAPALKKVQQPVLALNGTKDFQIPPKANLKGIAAALKSGDNKDFETSELDDLNHLFQTSETGLADEYAKIEETFSPVALDKITAWILSKTAKD